VEEEDNDEGINGEERGKGATLDGVEWLKEVMEDDDDGGTNTGFSGVLKTSKHKII
jgi:hypothetical protein